MKNEGLKVLSVEIENFKNISQKMVEFNGRSAMIVGKNGAGKSSFIQAVGSPTNAKLTPSKAIKEGEEKALIEIVVAGNLHGEEHHYNIGVHFTEKNQKGKVVILDKDGGKIQGARKMVESIVGNIGFDIQEFINLGLTKDGKVSKPGVREQIEILKGFLPQEAKNKLTELDNEKEEIYSSRADINRDIDSYKAKLKDIEMDPEEIEKYSEKKDDTEIKEKMGKIGEEISKYDGVKSKLSMKKDRKNYVDEEIDKLKKKLEEFESEQKELTNDIKKGDAWLEKNERPSMENLSKELEEISEHNKMFDKVNACKDMDTKLKEAESKAETYTERYKAIDGEKAEVFKANPLPVKDLTFSDDEILYQGLPFNENQHPSSTIIGVGLKIAMAMNPNLRLLIIKDGSLLDKKILNFVLKMVEKKGYQVLIEVVDFDGEKDLQVEFIESEVE